MQTFDFLVSKELLVRAWDETMNTQPAVITWNLMGMMNNCYHRCVISVMAKGHDEQLLSQVCDYKCMPARWAEKATVLPGSQPLKRLW